MSIFQDELEKDAKKVKLPSCLTLFNEWRMCSSSRSQFRHYYIYGKFSDCKEVQDNWSNCLAWKVKKSEDAKDSILRNLKEAENEKKKRHTACIWKFRRDPAKEWNE